MEIEFLSVDVLDVYQENITKEKMFIISNAELYSDRKWFRVVVFRNELGNVYVMQINEFLNNHTKL